jgi:SnoaL-like domain
MIKFSRIKSGAVRRKGAVLAAAVLAAGIAVPSAASAASAHGRQQQCAAEFDAAVHEDNNAYNARDIDRYTAILNPRMIFWYDGNVTYGRDAIIATAAANFAVPGWVWTYEIKSETVYGCHSGIAVLDTHTRYPDTGVDHHFAVTMQLVREDGGWTVAIDNVHLLAA